MRGNPDSATLRGESETQCFIDTKVVFLHEHINNIFVVTFALFLLCLCSVPTPLDPVDREGSFGPLDVSEGDMGHDEGGGTRLWNPSRDVTVMEEVSVRDGWRSTGSVIRIRPDESGKVSTSLAPIRSTGCGGSVIYRLDPDFGPRRTEVSTEEVVIIVVTVIIVVDYGCVTKGTRSVTSFLKCSRSSGTSDEVHGLFPPVRFGKVGDIPRRCSSRVRGQFL